MWLYTDMCCAKSLGHIWLFVPKEHQASLSVGFSRQEYWSVVAVPSSPPHTHTMEYCALSHSITSYCLQAHKLWPTGLLCPWGFSRQEYWSGLPCPPPGSLSSPGTEPRSPALQVDSLLSEPPGKPPIEYYPFIKKEWNSAICSNIDGPRDYHNKWS